MSMIRRRRRTLGPALGLAWAARSAAQELPPALPPLPEAPALAAPGLAPPPPPVRPAPSVVVVPPGGIRPTWAPAPVDPVALGRRGPKHVPAKARSWCWRRLQGKLWGYPEEFEPRPLGAALYDHARIMVANGAEARMVLHRYDFLPGSAELNPRGLDQLARLSAQLAAGPFPVIVERTPEDPALAESRRLAVLGRLASGHTPVSPDRVLVGVPAAAGVSGEEAERIRINGLDRVENYGPAIPRADLGGGGAP